MGIAEIAIIGIIAMFLLDNVQEKLGTLSGEIPTQKNIGSNIDNKIDGLKDKLNDTISVPLWWIGAGLIGLWVLKK